MCYYVLQKLYTSSLYVKLPLNMNTILTAVTCTVHSLCVTEVTKTVHKLFICQTTPQHE